MKIILKSAKSQTGGIFWIVFVDGNRTAYPYYDGALEYIRKKLKRATKEERARWKLGRIAVNLLNTHELGLIQRLTQTKCRGISKKQYGYLTGIYERQQQEW